MTEEELRKEPEMEETQKEKPKNYQEIRVIQSHGKGAVVEWVDKGKAYRKIVPQSKIKDNKIEEEALNKSPDYGVHWAKEIELSASSDDLEMALHNAGIWTPQDAMKYSSRIIGALNATYKSDLASILRVAKKYINKE